MKKILFLALVAFASCKPFDIPQQAENMVDVADKSIDQLEIPNGFTFKPTTKTHITLKAQDNSGKILSEIPFEIFIQQNTADSAFLLSGRTNTEGVFETDLELGSELGSELDSALQHAGCGNGGHFGLHQPVCRAGPQSRRGPAATH